MTSRTEGSTCTNLHLSVKISSGLRCFLRLANTSATTAPSATSPSPPSGSPSKCEQIRWLTHIEDRTITHLAAGVLFAGGSTRETRDAGCGATTISIFIGRSIRRTMGWKYSWMWRGEKVRNRKKSRDNG